MHEHIALTVCVRHRRDGVSDSRGFDHTAQKTLSWEICKIGCFQNVQHNLCLSIRKYLFSLEMIPDSS